MNIVAQNAKSIILKSGLKQKVIAEKVGYSEQQFSRILNERKVMKWDDVLHIALL